MEIVSVKKATTSKETLVNWFTQEVGGVQSYWNKIPADQLRALYGAIATNPEAKEALKKLAEQLKDARQTNTRLNRDNFGARQTASKLQRITESLIQANVELEHQKNELLKRIQELVGALTNYENSEIRQAILRVRNYIGSYIK